MTLERIGDCGLEFLYALVISISPAAVHLCEWCDVEFGLNDRIIVVSLATSTT